MYVGRDFDPADTGESERFTFDFINDLEKGDTITGVVWSCEVAAKSALPDPTAPSRVDGPAEYLGTRTSQRISGLLAGVTYALTATVTTNKNDIVMLWSHVECKDPA
jgi:hypothetical protein